MRRTFLANLALVLALNLLVKPFYILGIDAEVQERVGVEEYGGYAALLSLSFLLNILLDLGITNYNTRHTARNDGSIAERLSGVLAIRLVLVLLYASATLLCGVVMGYGLAQLSMLLVLCLNQAIAATVLYLRSNLAGARRYAQDSLLSVLDRVLLIGICSWVLWAGPSADAAMGIEWFVWAQTVAYAVALLVALVMVRGLAGGVAPRWRAGLLGEVLRESWPFALLILLMTAYYRMDTVLLERLRPDGAEQAGIYAQGFRFFEALNMIGYLFAGLLLPIFSRMLKEGGDIRGIAGLGWRLMMAGCLPVAVAALWWGGDLLSLRYGAVADGSAHSFVLLMCAFTAVGTTYIFGTLLTAKGDLRMLNVIAFGGVLLCLGLNVYLIPLYGAPGAAVACLVTQCATAVAQVILVTKAFQWQVPFSTGLRGAAYIMGLMVLAWGVSQLHFGAGGRSVVFAITACPLAFGTGLVRLPQLRALLRQHQRP